jgi:hypothetical protein
LSTNRHEDQIIGIDVDHTALSVLPSKDSPHAQILVEKVKELLEHFLRSITPTSETSNITKTKQCELALTHDAAQSSGNAMPGVSDTDAATVRSCQGGEDIPPGKFMATTYVTLLKKD